MGGVLATGCGACATAGGGGALACVSNTICTDFSPGALVGGMAARFASKHTNTTPCNTAAHKAATPKTRPEKDRAGTGCRAFCALPPAMPVIGPVCAVPSGPGWVAPNGANPAVKTVAGLRRGTGPCSCAQTMPPNAGTGAAVSGWCRGRRGSGIRVCTAVVLFTLLQIRGMALYPAKSLHHV
ncbi:TonB periplasmic protein [Acetobacter orientalis]|uniref:TonB periplasmic protein n=1 Tax=Acetobacter orientalis TaxID=146474 RepID=A0A2Z5ZKM6_9PROT|nr:TonB periplasmic protein [Acetobacter orientalis]